MTPVKIVSAFITVVFVGGAIAIGGGHPISPARIAATTSEAARNAAEAEANTARAAKSTRALATIAENVDSQVESSRRLLEVQLRLEENSRVGAKRSRDLQDGIAQISRALASLRDDIAALTDLSEQTVSNGEDAAAAGTAIEDRLSALQARFEEVIEQSRRLNRKARGYQEVRDGPGAGRGKG